MSDTSGGRIARLRSPLYQIAPSPNRQADKPSAQIARARKLGSEPIRTRLAPEDCKLDVQVFLASLRAGRPVREALKMAGLSERRVARWIAFDGFGAAVKTAKCMGRRAKRDPFSSASVDALVDLNIAIADRQEQQRADEYAGGDRERLHDMWMSGELMQIYQASALSGLRRVGKGALADHYERLLRDAPPGSRLIILTSSYDGMDFGERARLP